MLVTGSGRCASNSWKLPSGHASSLVDAVASRCPCRDLAPRAPAPDGLCSIGVSVAGGYTEFEVLGLVELGNPQDDAPCG